MDSILHLLGLCPDSFSHFDLVDVVICYYAEIQNIISMIRFKLGA